MKRLHWMAPGAVALAIAVACLAAGPARAEDKPLTKVRFAFPTPVMDLRYAPASVGIELGFFKEEGLDPTFQNNPGSGAALQAVMAGQLDLGTATAEPAMAARQKGIPVRYFYEWYTHVIYRIGVPADGTIRSVADLKGKKIGVQSFASAGVQYVRALVRTAGLDPQADVTLLPVGVGAQAATALKTGQVDALGLWDTQYAGLENLGLKFRYFTHPTLQNVASGGLFSSDEWLKKNPDVAERFGRAWSKAMVFIFANPEAAVRIHWKVFPKTKPRGVAEDEALRQGLHWLEAALRDHDRAGKENQAWGAMSPKEWQAYIDYLVQEKVIPASFPASEMITNEFIAKINDFDAAKIRAMARDYHVK
jgi:NitT/TauT family transport system substrate-binding protein